VGTVKDQTFVWLLSEGETRGLKIEFTCSALIVPKTNLFVHSYHVLNDKRKRKSGESAVVKTIHTRALFPRSLLALDGIVPLAGVLAALSR
jgi:hypothetical protein